MAEAGMCRFENNVGMRFRFLAAVKLPISGKWVLKLPEFW